MPLKTLTLADILTFPVVTVVTGSSVKTALKLMHKNRISSLVVMENDRPVGIFTERDAVLLSYRHQDRDRLQVDDVMGSPLVTAAPEADYREGYRIISESRVRHLVVLDRQGKLAGIVSESAFIAHLGSEYLLRCKEVEELMSRDMATLPKEAAVEDAVELMCQQKLSSIVIVDSGRPAGIISERDLVRLVSTGEDLSAVRLDSVMSRPVCTVTVTTLLPEALQTMERRQIRRLVVVDDCGLVAGQLTQHDIVKTLYDLNVEYLRKLITDREREVNELRSDLALERELRRSEKLLENSRQFAQIGNWQLNLDTGRMCLSKEAMQILETKAGSDLSKDGFLDLLHPDDKQLVEDSLRQLPSNGDPHALRYRLQFPDGRVRHIDQLCETYFDQAHRPVYITGLIRDITQNHRHEAEKAQLNAMFSALIESTDDAIFIKDKALRYRVVNRATAEIFKRPPEDIIGLGDDALFADNNVAAKIKAEDKRIMQHGDTLTFEETVQVSGQTRTFLTTKGPLVIGGEIQGIFGIARDISQMKASHAALRSSEEKLQLFFLHAPVALAMFDCNMRYLAASRRWMTDFDLEGREILGQCHYDLFPDLPEHWQALHRRGLSGEVLHNDCEQVVWQDGSVQWLRWVLRPWYEVNGDIGGIVIFSEDISERKQAELRQLQYATVFENLAEGIMITDGNCKITAINPTFTQITGYREDEVLGQSPGFLSSGCQDAQFYTKMWESLLEKGQWQGEIWNRRKNGEIYPEWLCISCVKDPDGRTVNYVGVFSDISEFKKSEDALRFLAHHDPLTGLPNRLYLLERLDHYLKRGQRSGLLTAVLFIDLDCFKDINDNLGHASGDLVLQQVADRLRGLFRAEDTIARIGGDEFVVVLEEIKHSRDLNHVAAKVLDAVSQPVELACHRLILTASVGISVCPQDGRDSASLLKHADIALYRANAQGRNSFEFFSEDMETSSLELMYLYSALQSALKKQEFTIHYQPQVNIENGKTIGIEALVRWNSPEFGFVSPARFIPLSEETGLIVSLGEWILQESCRQMKAWLDDGMQLDYMAVNLSGRQLADQGLVDKVRSALQESGLSAGFLELEITESTLMDENRCRRILGELKDIGIRISIDDFGTGYSSLSRLKHFPLDKLKIDQSFVNGVLKNQGDSKITQAVIRLAESLSLDVIAEGVETREQIDFLLENGCKKVQGYYFSRPLPPQQLEDWFLAQERACG